MAKGEDVRVTAILECNSCVRKCIIRSRLVRVNRNK